MKVRSKLRGIEPGAIKDGFAFGELGRRGIDAVGDELLEKVLAYNFCRIILMKKRGSSTFSVVHGGGDVEFTDGEVEHGD